jgi:hypothetical protein
MRKLNFQVIASAVALCMFLSFSNLSAKNDPVAQMYISQISAIAQLESQRSGIPASIILAQAILESGFGKSDLTRRSKNHFGIKWKGEQDGDFVYSLDDDHDKKGNRIESKFVKYENVYTSFRHHSDFLMKRKNYSPLFRFSSRNYHAWANGLYFCGYSSDKEYGKKLLSLIARYSLNAFDVASAQNPTLTQTTSKKKFTRSTSLYGQILGARQSDIAYNRFFYLKKHIQFEAEKQMLPPNVAFLQPDFGGFTHEIPAPRSSGKSQLWEFQYVRRKSIA